MISEQLQTRVLPHIENFSGGLITAEEPATGALIAGFVAGGGVGGTLGVPSKLVRVATGYPKTPSRMEAARMFNSSNKELGRALAVIASADRQMRGRGGLLGLLMPTPRKVMLAGGAYYALNSVDPELLGPVAPMLEKVKAPITDAVALLGPLLDSLKDTLAARIDAIQ
jgi:hypothetical protein